MSNPNLHKHGIETQFKPGKSGHPGGKPVAARNRLQGDFVKALADDFEVHGVQAIQRLREKDVATYIRVIASLVPKQLEISRPLDEMDDETLDAAIIAVRSLIAAKDRQLD